MAKAESINWRKVKDGDRFTAVVYGIKRNGSVSKGVLFWYLCFLMNKTEDESIYHSIEAKSTYVKNLKIISQTKKPMANKQARPGKVVKSWHTETGEVWEIYSHRVKGTEQFGNRLIGKNGYIITGNSGFDSKRGADYNISLVESRSKRIKK